MTDYYHFFGIKDKESRFLMRLKNPYGFGITTAQIALSGLFSTHGSCPASNDVTWSPWKAGKTIYQLWNVTPNKLGLIKSATPTLTLDGVPYLGLSIYLLSLADYVKFYTNHLTLSPGEISPEDFLEHHDLDYNEITGEFADFIPVSYGEFDAANMTGIFMQNKFVAVDWGTIKTWVEAGNIYIESFKANLAGIITVLNGKPPTISAGDIITVVQSDVELSPICNKSVSARATGYVGKVSAVYPPVGWTSRPLVQFTHGGTTYDMIVELIHTASGGRVIYVGGYQDYINYYYQAMLDGWWWPILLFQYPMMKFAGVSTYYTE